MGTEQRHDILLSIDPGIGEFAVKRFRQPRKERHPVPWQKGKTCSVRFKDPPLVRHGNKEITPRLEHSMNLREGLCFVLDVLQHRKAYDSIKMFVNERQGRSIVTNGRDPLDLVVLEIPAQDVQVILVYIARDYPASQLHKLKSLCAIAGAKIQDQTSRQRNGGGGDPRPAPEDFLAVVGGLAPRDLLIRHDLYLSTHEREGRSTDL